MTKKIQISVIIITKDRPDKLNDCLLALSKSTFKNFELIIVDQSSRKKINSKPQAQSYKFKISCVHSKKAGKSRGLNLAIKRSNAPLLAFTDDDCLPDKKWLETISKTFENHKNIVGLFGRTVSYKPKEHRGFICPSTFNHKKSKYITKPCKHWEEIGFGNNMAWRKSFFNRFGLFKEWLGPGSIGMGAEDAEIALRALIRKQTIFYNSNALVSHNKWLTKKGYQKQKSAYARGEIACYGYLLLLGQEVGKKVILENVKRNILKIKNLIKCLPAIISVILLKPKPRSQHQPVKTIKTQ